MRVLILGVCGTFMAGVAVIAKQLGYEVIGCDENVYPPMSTFLDSAGIRIEQGFAPTLLNQADMVIVGNVMKRGMAIIETMLNVGTPMFSGPEWLASHALSDKWVLCVTGTHGKTTTASMLAWILEFAGLTPGFLIGGIADNFGFPARINKSDFFVIEGDEYDTAFFDKRSKFIHYRPKTLILGNLEFDHADIFDDLGMIQRQFHHLLKILPSEGLLVRPQQSAHIDAVTEKGLWSPVETIGYDGAWQAACLQTDGSEFKVSYQGKVMGTVSWPYLGEHNVNNALGAIAAAHHVGVKVETACEALCSFKGVKRRLQLRGEQDGVKVYDDFAHHPTAIKTTLMGMKAHVKNGRVFAVLEPRSNTMRMGAQALEMKVALELADAIFLYEPQNCGFDLKALMASSEKPCQVFGDTQALIEAIHQEAKTGDHVVVMSNGGFENIHERLLGVLAL